MDESNIYKDSYFLLTMSQVGCWIKYGIGDHKVLRLNYMYDTSTIPGTSPYVIVEIIREDKIVQPNWLRRLCVHVCVDEKAKGGWKLVGWAGGGLGKDVECALDGS